MAEAVLDEVTGDYQIALQTGERVTTTIRTMINLLSIQHGQVHGIEGIILIPNLVGYPSLGDATCYKDRDLAENLARLITMIGDKLGLPF